MIPYGKQHISEDDIQAVVDVLRSDYLTQGPIVPAFEDALCAATGAQHAVAVNSATSALHIACRALDLGPGDWLWTTPISFVASANCGLYCGAQVDFVDIDPRSFNMSVTELEKKLRVAEQQGVLPKIVIPVHLCGSPCDMAAIAQLAERFGFRVIEDASHALGANYRGTPVGRCNHSDITVFSFHPVKMITSGEGGAALTNNSGLAERMQRLRNHGITRVCDEMTEPPHGKWYYQQLELGHNYRLSDIHAALGLSQLSRLEAFVSKRRQLAGHYQSLLIDLPMQLQRCNEWESCFHLLTLRIKDENQFGLRDLLYRELHRKGIAAQVHYIPIHTQPFFKSIAPYAMQFPQAESYYREALSLPLYVGIDITTQQHICNVIRHFFEKSDFDEAHNITKIASNASSISVGGEP